MIGDTRIQISHYSIFFIFTFIPGLSYNPTLYVCDWPWNVPCYHIPKLVYDNIKPIAINVTEDSEKWQLAAINKMIEDNNKNMSSS